MIPFLLKMTICAGLLLAIYILFFEKERMHKLKRFYLLFSLVFAITIPLVTVEMPQQLSSLFPEQATGQLVAMEQQGAAIQQPNQAMAAQPDTANVAANILLLIYAAVAGTLLIRYLLNIYRLSALIRKSRVIRLDKVKIVLVTNRIVPHSFLNYIFVDKDEYQNGMIENQVLAHEMTHVRQRHSADILFIELLLIIFWFNPILFMYRNKMKLNHEFLADEGVISRFENIPQYQFLLLSKAARKNNLSFTSDLNYSLTKKRLIMMTTTTTRRVALLKKATLLPVFLLFAFTFCTKKASQQPTEESKPIETQAATQPAATQQTPQPETTATADTEKEDSIIRFKPPFVLKDGDTAPPPPTIVKDEKEVIPPPPPISELRIKVEPSEGEINMDDLVFVSTNGKTKNYTLKSNPDVRVSIDETAEGDSRPYLWLTKEQLNKRNKAE